LFSFRFELNPRVQFRDTVLPNTKGWNIFPNRIAGFAGTYESWAPQVKGLTGAMEPVDEEAPADDDDGSGVEVCCFDNRGMGRSSVPAQKSQCTCVPASTFP